MTSTRLPMAAVCVLQTCARWISKLFFYDKRFFFLNNFDLSKTWWKIYLNVYNSWQQYTIHVSRYCFQVDLNWLSLWNSIISIFDHKDDVTHLFMSHELILWQCNVSPDFLALKNTKIFLTKPTIPFWFSIWYESIGFDWNTK